MDLQAITLPGNLDALEPMVAYLAEISAKAGLDKKAGYKLRLAVDEIVTNIIVHGYGDAGLTGEVEVRSRIENQQLTIVVDDHATPYDPFTTQKPDMTSDWEQRQMGGFGVYFAQVNVDEFRYEFVDNHNRNTFVVNLPRA